MKTFNYVSHLRTHILIHNKEKPQICQKCTKSFTRPGDLNKHILIHSGENLRKVNNVLNLLLISRNTYTQSQWNPKLSLVISGLTY